MANEHSEEYIGAIHRLQEGSSAPLRLSVLRNHFHFSLISVHEMVQKLSDRGLLEYKPYSGVTLTDTGRNMAVNLIRRHRIWERFLTDRLDVALDQAHELAGSLEHAAPDWVTERLLQMLSEADHSPKRTSVLLQEEVQEGKRLVEQKSGAYRLVRISPEQVNILRLLEKLEIRPGASILKKGDNFEKTSLEVNGKAISLVEEALESLWVVEE